MDETSGFVEVIESVGFFVWGVGGDQNRRNGADIACAISTTALRPRGRNSIDNDRDRTFAAQKILEHLKLYAAGASGNGRRRRRIRLGRAQRTRTA